VAPSATVPLEAPAGEVEAQRPYIQQDDSVRVSNGWAAGGPVTESLAGTLWDLGPSHSSALMVSGRASLPCDIRLTTSLAIFE
jgi:hypothetical protein